MKVFISTTTFARDSREPLEILRKQRIKYTLNPYGRKLRETEIEAVLGKDSYCGLVAGTETLTERVLRNAGSLKVISRVGAGMDNVCLETAKKLGIKVYNTPSVLTDSVAELTMGLILCCLRKIASADRNLRRNIWRKEMGSLLKGKVIGIIGFGRIGMKVARLVRAFGAEVLFYDVKQIKNRTGKKVPLKTLFRQSDIISIHSSVKEQLIAKKEISGMKRGVILINTARGGIIDESSLYNALLSGKIACAALDVYDNEPYSGRLSGLDNIILTPHIGSYAREARIKMETEAVKNLIKGLEIVMSSE